MTASAANGFAQVKFDPERHVLHGHSVQLPPDVQHLDREDPGDRGRRARTTSRCDTEIGHFQYCNGPIPIPATPFGAHGDAGNPTSCPIGDTEGQGASAQPSDGDDFFCFPGSEALTYKVSGCTYTNTGFDGVS